MGRRLPPGRVATYGDVARLAGRPQAAHAVGAIMRACRDDRTPCHRVVSAGGRLGGYGGVPGLKRSLLQAEGVQTSGTRILNMGRVRWNRTGKPGERAKDPT